VATPGPQRYYTPWQITVATVLGGPIAGGFLSFRDHALFGNRRRANRVLWVSSAIFVALVVVGFLSPPKTSGTPLAGAVAGMYRWYAGEAFGPEIARRSKEGWVRQSWWKAVGWGFLFLLGLALLILIAAILVRKS